MLTTLRTPPEISHYHWLSRDHFCRLERSNPKVTRLHNALARTDQHFFSTRISRSC